MSKTYREFVAEVAKPIAQDEIDFLDKHVTILIDYPDGTEDQFTGGDMQPRKFRLADYKPNQDKAVYEKNLNLKGDEEINKKEAERHGKQEMIKKIIDEASIPSDVEKQDLIEMLNSLSDKNLKYAIENNINVIEFLVDLMP